MIPLELRVRMDDRTFDAKWVVTYASRAEKQRRKLPQKVQETLDLLALELEKVGPLRSNWPHFGPLKGKGLPEHSYHCHIKSGRPTFVSCWFIVDKKLKKVEIFYVGTHENAPY